MTTPTNQISKENSTLSPTDNLKGIENHKKTALHLEKAAKHHLEAAKQHEAGEHEKACQSTVTAQGHLIIANEAQKEDAKLHALNCKMEF